jgi:hypothetical protein
MEALFYDDKNTGFGLTGLMKALKLVVYDEPYSPYK